MHLILNISNYYALIDTKKSSCILFIIYLLCVCVCPVICVYVCHMYEEIGRDHKCHQIP